MKKINLKDDTLTESGFKKLNYPIYPKDSKTTTDKRFKYIDNGEQGGTHWTSFYIKDIKSFYFPSFGGQPEKFLLQQLLKLNTFYNYKNNDINS